MSGCHLQAGGDGKCFGADSTFSSNSHPAAGACRPVPAGVNELNYSDQGKWSRCKLTQSFRTTCVNEDIRGHVQCGYTSSSHRSKSHLPTLKDSWGGQRAPAGRAACIWSSQSATGRSSTQRPPGTKCHLDKLCLGHSEPLALL